MNGAHVPSKVRDSFERAVDLFEEHCKVCRPCRTPSRPLCPVGRPLRDGCLDAKAELADWEQYDRAVKA